MLVALVIVTGSALWPPPPTVRAQAVDVYINVTGGGSKKLNITIPEFTLVAGTDTALAKLLASVAGNDLTLSGLFSVVAAEGSIPANNPRPCHGRGVVRRRRRPWACTGSCRSAATASRPRCASTISRRRSTA